MMDSYNLFQDEVKKLQERLREKEAQCEKLQADMEDQVISETLRQRAHAICSNFKCLLFFLIFAQNIDCGYTIELPH